MNVARIARAGLAALVVVMAAACGDDPTDPNSPAALTKVSADSQTVQVGVPMPQPLVVALTGGGGAPLPNVEVIFNILDGGGATNDTTVNTDADGHAQVTYTPGTKPGPAHVLVAAGGLSTTFTLTLAIGPATALQKFGSDNPAAVVGSKLTLSVKVVDAFGNGIGGGVVNWSASGGTVSAATSTADTNGVASVEYTTGATAGTYTLTASMAGLPSSTFTIKAL